MSEQKTKRVLVKPDRLLSPGKGGEKTSGRKTLHVNHGVIVFLSDLAQEPQQVSLFVLLLVPDQHLSQVRMTCQERFIALSYQKVNPVPWKKPVKFFYQNRCQNDVANERGLND